MNHGWTYCDTIHRDADGSSIADYYARRYPHDSVAAWQARIIAGEVLRNGQTALVGQPLRAGDRLLWNRPPWEEPPAPLHYAVCYRDEEVLVVDKPAGLPVLPGGGFLENTLLYLVRNDFSASPARPVPVHRLGRGTSGLVAFARSQHAAQSLCRQFRHPDTQSTVGDADAFCAVKRYRAITSIPQNNANPVSAGTTVDVRTPIAPVPHPILGNVHAATPDGRPSRSLCTLLRCSDTEAEWDIDLKTGRPHQIRIHLASIGYPLLGDPLFLPGGIPRPDAVPGAIGYLLRAYRLTFFHPVSGQTICVDTSPDPRTGFFPRE